MSHQSENDQMAGQQSTESETAINIEAATIAKSPSTHKRNNIFVLKRKSSRPKRLTTRKSEEYSDDKFRGPPIRTLTSPELDAEYEADEREVAEKKHRRSRSRRHRRRSSKRQPEVQDDKKESAAAEAQPKTAKFKIQRAILAIGKAELKNQQNGDLKPMSRLRPPDLTLHTISDQFKESNALPGTSPDSHLLKSPATLQSPSQFLSASSSSLGMESSRPSSTLSFMVRERLHSLTRDLSRRTRKVKAEIKQPPTPDSVSVASVSADEKESAAPQADRRSLGSFVKEFASASPRSQLSDAARLPLGYHSWPKKLWFRAKRCHFLPDYFDNQTKAYLGWLAVVSMAFLYNAYAVPLRASYPYQTKDNLWLWMLLDYSCDMIYLADMIFFKKDKKQMRTYYLRSWTFKLDMLALFPLDIFYLLPATKFSPLLRLPRLLKVNTYRDFFYNIDSRVDNPYVLRVVKTLTYLTYLVHCNSAVFYSISFYEGFGSNDWVYSGKGNAYIRCFYFAFKIGTGIGNNNSPTNVYEHLFMTFSWLMGVFVFALLLGQIRDIVATASKNKETYRKAMDTALQHCKALKISKPTQEKVRLWFIHTWEEQKTLNENMLIEKLPRKMQTDLAISVHYQVLSKVKLFQDCDKALLRDLVLKLQPVLFLPGDFVCRKGEVGKEMYIVNKGMVQVIGGPKNEVLVTLKEGSVFGEIALLAMSGSGGNRRTADVRSRGFSMLFILSKADLHDTIKDYPDAQKILKKKAKRLLAESKARQEEADNKQKAAQLEETCKVPNAWATPKFMETVMHVIDPNSETAKTLQKAITPKHTPSMAGTIKSPEGMDEDIFSDISSLVTEEKDGALPDIILNHPTINTEDDEEMVVIRTEHESA